jgi:hypothetical protein
MVGRGTTRKKATRGAPLLLTRNALSMRGGYHAAGNLLPVEHQPMRYG